MSRLLHAAARGARIQEQRQFGSEWVDTVCIVVPDYEVTPQRIHPDDAYLAYGPISTALRDAAAAGNAYDLTTDFGRMAMAYACRHEFNWTWFPEFDRSLFLLILAEALADEGM